MPLMPHDYSGRRSSLDQETSHMHVSTSRKRFGAIAISLGLFATACGGTATNDASAPVDGATEVVEESTGGAGLPQLIGNTVAGSQFDTNDLAGQDVAVWFWAPW